MPTTHAPNVLSMYYELLGLIKDSDLREHCDRRVNQAFGYVWGIEDGAHIYVREYCGIPLIDAASEFAYRAGCHMALYQVAVQYGDYGMRHPNTIMDQWRAFVAGQCLSEYANA